MVIWGKCPTCGEEAYLIGGICGECLEETENVERRKTNEKLEEVR